MRHCRRPRSLRQLYSPLDGEPERLAHRRHKALANFRVLPATDRVLLRGIQNPISRSELGGSLDQQRNSLPYTNAHCA